MSVYGDNSSVMKILSYKLLDSLDEIIRNFAYFVLEELVSVNNVNNHEFVDSNLVRLAYKK